MVVGVSLDLFFKGNIFFPGAFAHQPKHFPDRSQTMEPKRNTMKKPVKSDNAVEKALMDGVGKWVNAFNAFPIPYEIDLATLAGMVRTAYEEVATQPSFRVTKAHKGPL